MYRAEKSSNKYYKNSKCTLKLNKFDKIFQKFPDVRIWRHTQSNILLLSIVLFVCPLTLTFFPNREDT